MLTVHNYFHFRPFSDKANDLIFLKSPKTLFSGHFFTFFGVFPEVLFFLENRTHAITFRTSCKISNERILRKECCDGHTDPNSNDPGVRQRSKINLPFILNYLSLPKHLISLGNTSDRSRKVQTWLGMLDHIKLKMVPSQVSFHQ